MNVLLFALGHQARQAHQEDVPHAGQKTLNVFLCRCEGHPSRLVFGHMEAGLPWSEYSKDPLPRGYSHALGRDEIERALRAAGAEIGSLSLGPPSGAVGEPASMIFDVYCIGDGTSRTRGPDLDRDRLLMRWCAVPAPLRSVFAAPIVDQWLPEACSWAASAPGRGNVWRATDHRWMLLRCEEEPTVQAE